MTTLEITYDDIARGKPGDTHSCPVVLAATKAFHCSSQEISVGGFQLVHMPAFTDDIDIYELPGRAQAWIAAFDRGEQMQPITFDIMLTDRSCRPECAIA